MWSLFLDNNIRTLGSKYRNRSWEAAFSFIGMGRLAMNQRILLIGKIVETAAVFYKNICGWSSILTGIVACRNHLSSFADFRHGEIYEKYSFHIW